jgi:hypothetical protein
MKTALLILALAAALAGCDRDNRNSIRTGSCRNGPVQTVPDGANTLALAAFAGLALAAAYRLGKGQP